MNSFLINRSTASMLNFVAGLALLQLAPLTSCLAQQGAVTPPVASSTATTVDALPVKVAPIHSSIRYVGRFDRKDSKGPRCSWSASRIVVRFSGAALNVLLNDSGNINVYQVVVDGTPTMTLPLDAGSHRYNLFHSETSGIHTLELIKRTEGFCGVTQVEGFELSANGKMLAPPSAKHRIEIVGDSISCGYGNEASDQKQRFSPATENAYQTYGSIVARAVDADLVCVAWSGRQMWPHNTMDEVYGRALATDPNSVWDFSQWVPDVVIVTLGTNDFAKGSPEPAGWISGYRAFLARVRKDYPRVAIYCATSPMMGGDPAKILREYLDEIVRQEQEAGHKNVRVLPFATQDAKNGLGADWHPSKKTHRIMADQLIAVLKQDLRWRPTVARLR